MSRFCSEVFGVEGGDVRQMPKPAVEIETIPDDELVRNVEPDMVGCERHLRPTGLPQEHERSHPGGTPLP